MEFRVDEDAFDELQPWFVGQMIESVRSHLRSSGRRGLESLGDPEDPAIKELCGKIVFHLCTLLDGSAPFEVEGVPHQPILAFAGADETDVAIHPGGAAGLHEYVFGVLDEIFEEES